jgi:hypothetical protein
MSDELVTWVEIDIEVCSRRFGVAPCTASLGPRTPRKCVNAFLTCADTDNYTASTATITLTKQGQVGLPIGGRYFPCLQDVRETEQTVNIAGSDPKLDAIGRRATVEIRAHDFVYADRFLDPYYDERISGAAQFDDVGYEPSGPFWARLRGRDPYFAGYPIRVHRGRVVGGELVSDRVTHYLATEFDPRGDGSVTWRGVDVLDLASNERALVPVPSQGRLAADLAIGVNSLTLTPEGVGAEYAAFGFVTIGREIMYFVRTGDTMSLTRGLFNTEQAAHSAFAAVQEAYRFTGKAHEAVNDLLRNFGKVPESWIPLEEWADEALIWFDVDVDVILTKPIEVKKAVAELSILGFSIYTDLAAQKIRFRPNRFLFPDERDNVPVIADDDIIGVLDYDGRDAERLTRVELRSVQIDPTRELSDDNFVQQHLSIAGDSEDPRAYGDIRYRLEKTRWLNQGNNNLIRILANRYLRRFKTGPERLTLKVKRRKYGDIPLTTVVGVSSRKIPSAWGQVEQRLFQVISRNPSGDGEILLKLQRFEYEGNFGFWAPDDAPDYADATPAQKDRMAFWGPNTGDTFADGRKLYTWG